MNIAYVRVSTVHQNEERQVKNLEKYGIDKWFIEKASAKTKDRPVLQQMIEFAREGDSVYVDDFSRASRSLQDLLEMVEIFNKNKVAFISVKENLDTSTPTGKLLLTMMGAINEFQRENLLERQREGIALAKENGKYKGRKEVPLPSNWNDIYPLYKNKVMPLNRTLEVLGLKKSTFYKFIEKYEKSNSYEYKSGDYEFHYEYGALVIRTVFKNRPIGMLPTAGLLNTYEEFEETCKSWMKN